MTTNPEVSAHLVTTLLHLPVTSSLNAFECAAAATQRLVVSLDRPPAECRSALQAFVMSGINAELLRRGAAAPGHKNVTAFKPQLEDAVYRCRLIGSRGLALRLAELDAIADSNRELCVEDSGTLRELLELSETLPLQLYFPDATSSLRVVGVALPFSEWLSDGCRAGRIASIEYEGATGVSEAKEGEGLTAEKTTPTAQDQPARLDAPPVAAFLADREVERELSPQGAHSAAERVDGASAAGQKSPAPPRAVVDPEQARRCAGWASQLTNMSGPKVHNTVEQAFVTAYLPLRRAVVAGHAPNEAQRAATAWAEGFAQSYAAAFKRLNSHTRRPKMVRDVAEMSARWLGRHQARGCQLLLVDGLRFDLGQRLNQCINERLRGRVVCADQTLLWAALPSNARSQSLAHTPAGANGDAAGGIQKLTVGSREMFRLDRIGSDLDRAGEVEHVRLDRLALSLADSVVPWLQEQPPGTLVVVFGDHGFHWETTTDGTSAAQYGGALPEQVLVPASGWLVGEGRGARAASAQLH